MANSVSCGGRVIRFGGSIDMRESVVWATNTAIAAQVTLTGTQLKVITSASHNLHNDTYVVGPANRLQPA